MPSRDRCRNAPVEAAKCWEGQRPSHTAGNLPTETHWHWLGRQDSNLGMAESKSAALPLGYAPLRRRIAGGRAGPSAGGTIAASCSVINVLQPSGRRAGPSSQATAKTGKFESLPRVCEGTSMSVSRPSIVETRRDQILPLLDATDIERAWRFGEVRRFATGEALAAIGEVGVGLGIILGGRVDVYRYDAHGERQHFFN